MRDGQPVGRVEITKGGMWNWGCDATGEHGTAVLIEEALDLVRATATLALFRPN